MLSSRRRLRILLVLVLCGSCSLYYWPVMETKIPGRFDGAPIDTQAPYLTEDEEKLATAILKASGVVERINRGRSWTPDFDRRRRTNAIPGTRGVRVDVVWYLPVDTSGPWPSLYCFGTRKIMRKQQWHGVTRLATWVDLDARAVEGYRVTSQPKDIPGSVMGRVNMFSLAKVYDVESGDLLLFGPQIAIPPKSVLCPPNRYYSYAD